MNNHTLPGPLKLFSSSWQFYRSHWKPLTTIVLLPYGAIFIGNLISQIGFTVSSTSQAAGNTLGILGFIVFVVGLVFMIAAVSGLISGIHRLSSEPGHAIHFWNQYKLGFRYFWPLVLVGIMRGAATFGASAIFIIPGIIFAVYSTFVLFSLVVDDKHGMAAFTEGFAIVHNRWWKVFGRLVLVILAYVVAVLIVTGLAFVLRTIFHYPVESLADGIVTGVLMSALMLAFLPYVMTYLYKMFHALKTSRVEHTRAKLYKELFIALMVIGAVIFISALIFGPILNSKQGTKRVPYNGSMAVAPLHTHGDLVL